ncbi:MAG: TetR/AcrR family transcriptional regulator [Myxococcota bacterium]
MARANKQPVGRPRQFEVDDVLDAAMNIFWRHGIRATTTRDLKDALGLSESSIYNTFGSKDGLLDAALTRYEEQVTGEMFSPFEGENSGFDAFEVFFDDLGHWVTHDGRHGCFIINVMAENGGERADLTRRTRRYRNRMRRVFESALKSAADAGETDPDQVSTRASMLVAMILGINVAARGGASAKEMTQMIDGTRRTVRLWRH